MAKFRPGIPDTFTLDVDPVRDLGDYLDEPRPTPVAPRKAREETVPPPSTPAVLAPEPAPINAPPAAAVFNRQAVVEPVTSPAPLVAPAPPQPAKFVFPPDVSEAFLTPANVGSPLTEPEREERGGKEKAPRREISMTPETLRMSDELLEVVRGGSGQRDTKANELMHALVLLVYEALDHVDPHTIPKRGRWGTPTARAYPRELKNAFLRALLEKYGPGADGVGVSKYPADSAG